MGRSQEEKVQTPEKDKPPSQEIATMPFLWTVEHEEG
tara:strand:- start:3685 stop:3795 length:111 start_codon:yes stop_codon:yes gene_type:complete